MSCLDRELARIRAEREPAYTWLAPGVRLMTADEYLAIQRLCVAALQKLSDEISHTGGPDA